MLCEDDPDLFDAKTREKLVEILQDFSLVYNSIHPFLCLLLCPIGILANTIHILILCQRKMRDCAVNVCMIGIAICDIFTMASYFAYILRFEIAGKILGVQMSHFWAIFLLVHATTTIALHTITLYTCVTMALIRWWAMRWPYNNNNMLRPKIAWRIFASICVIIVVICLPTYLVHEVVVVVVDESDTISRSNEQENLTRKSSFDNNSLVSVEYFNVDISTWATNNHCRYLKANLFIIGVVLKAIPCILMCWFTAALMNRIRKRNARREALICKGVPSGIGGAKIAKGHDRTTPTLIVMLTVFLLTELPQGILAVLNGIYTNEIHTIIYVHLANLLDLLSLINCYVGFIAYGIMSSNYRRMCKAIIFSFIRKCREANSRLFAKDYKNLCGTVTSKSEMELQINSLNSFGAISSKSVSSPELECLNDIARKNSL